jgi:hypothetical protein
VFFALSERDVYSLVIPASARSSEAQCCFAAANNSRSHISLLTERGYPRLPIAINIAPGWGEIQRVLSTLRWPMIAMRDWTTPADANGIARDN